MEFGVFLFVFLAVITNSQCKELTPDEIEHLKSQPGHMKPLGSVGPYFDVPVVDGFVGPREFFNKYAIPSIPVVFKGAAKASPAWDKWSDEYLMNHPEAANTSVFAEGRKKEVRTMGGYMISFKKFVEKYKENDIYMVNMVPGFMKPDVLIPKPLLCDPVVEGFSDNVMWFSNGGTKSVLHNDDVDNINCLYRGNKTLIFINPHDTNAEWVTRIINRPMGSYSTLDVDAVDFTEYPDLVGVRYAKIEMKAGDCLFIPFKWHHQVNSFGNNLAVNLWFNHFPHLYFDLDESKCGDYSTKKFLNQFEFQTVENSDEGGIYGSPEEDKLPGEEGAIPNEENAAPQQPSDQETLGDQIYEIVIRRKKAVKPAGIKRYVLKTLPENTQIWDDHCDKLLDGFVSILDRNEDGMIDETDVDLFDQLEPAVQKKYREASSLFFDEVMVGVQVATIRKDQELLKILLDRGELDPMVVEAVFGKEFLEKHREERASQQKNKEEL